MKDEYDFSRMKSRPNPYAERLKQQQKTVFDDDVQILINEKILPNEPQRQRLNEIIRLVFATP